MKIYQCPKTFFSIVLKKVSFSGFLFAVFVCASSANADLIVTISGAADQNTATVTASGSLEAPQTANFNLNNLNAYLPIGDSWLNTGSVQLPGLFFKIPENTNVRGDLSSPLLLSQDHEGGQFTKSINNLRLLNLVGDDRVVLQGGGLNNFLSKNNGGGDLVISGSSTITFDDNLEDLFMGSGSYSVSAGGLSNENYTFNVDITSPVPEPSSLILIGGACGGLFLRRNRRC